MVRGRASVPSVEWWVSKAGSDGLKQPVPPTRRQRVAATLAVLALLPLAACGGGPSDTFDLLAATDLAGSSRARGQLVVLEPAATSPADSDRIVVHPTPNTVATLKGAQWPENLPRLLQTRLIQSFENSRLLARVARPGEGIEANAQLATEIRRFDIDIATGQAVVEISAKLVSTGSGRVLAAKVFSASEPGDAKDGAGAARALNAAFASVARDMVSWTAVRF